MDSPYAGNRAGLPANPGPHLLVAGPTGVGKTRRVLAPAVAYWPGPVITVSSKPDLAALLLRVGTVGAGIDSGGDVFWTTLATPPLAALLLNAAVTGAGIGEVTAAIGDLTAWGVACDRIAEDAPALAAALTTTATMEERMRSSVIATMAPAVAAWLRQAIAPTACGQRNRPRRPRYGNPPYHRAR